MTKLMIPVAASLLLSVAPAWADLDTETRVEERVEEKSNGLASQRTRTVETETEKETDDDESTTVRRKETIEADGDTVERTVEQKTEHSDDD